MIILAIDPGSLESGVVQYNTETMRVSDHVILPNADVLAAIHRSWGTDHIAIEMIGHYGSGMAVGKDVFHACLWIGRFMEAWGHRNGVKNGPANLILRKSIAAHICGSANAGDSNIRRAIIDRYEPTGGGKTPQIGTKKRPGPLYGIKEDEWNALAVAITYAENPDCAMKME